MANKIIWRGQSANLTIGQIQNATKAHISAYVFYSNTADLGGLSEYNTTSTSVVAQASVNGEKDYTITSYLLYSHKFAGGTAYATSNKVDNVLTVHEPLDEKSLVRIEPVNTGNYKDWVWSNAPGATFKIIPTFASYAPYSKLGTIKSDATNPAEPKGSTNTLTREDISSNNELAWSKTTGSTTDLGKESENITVYVESTVDSAPTAKRIDRKNATFVVRNAVTALSGLEDTTLYAGSTSIQVPVTITPARPYNTDLILVNENGQDTEGTITSAGGAIVEIDEQSVWLNASKVKPGTDKQIIKFKVRSRQSNAPVDTKDIIFTVNAVANITGKTVVEGGTISVEPHIGVIQTATITSGNTAISVSKSGETLSITGLAVDTDTPWSITVTNAAGAHITISGKTTYLADVSTSINTGDYIIIGTELLAGLGASITEIITQPGKGKASLEGGKLKYEASTTNGPIAADTYAIKVKGANGATRTVNINVSNITATLS